MYNDQLFVSKNCVFAPNVSVKWIKKAQNYSKLFKKVQNARKSPYGPKLLVMNIKTLHTGDCNLCSQSRFLTNKI